MSSDTPGFRVNAATIGLFLGLVSVGTVGLNVSGYFQRIENKNLEQDMRLDRTDRDRTRNIDSINKLTDKTGELKEAVVRLTTVIEMGAKSRKAELEQKNPGTAPIPAVYRVKK